MTTVTDPSSHSRTLPHIVLLTLAFLLVAELGAIATIFKHQIPFYCGDNWPPLACRTASLTLVSLYCVFGALVLAAILRPAPFRDLVAGARLRLWPLLANAAGVGFAFVPLAFLIEGQARNTVLPAFTFWTLGMGLILGGLALCLAPLTRWRQFLIETGSALVPAIAAGVAAPWLAVLIRPAWRGLDGIASVTFSAVAWIIDMLGYEVQTNVEGKWLGAGEFFISVAPQCSGVEGFALVTLFVTLYLWLFRADLRFPRALLLYPVGLAASATFNVIRIAALLVIGLEGNPELAVGGFHSHAGWLMFTLVALGIIALAQTVPALKRAPVVTASTSTHILPFWRDPIVARILPFAVFMLGALLASALSANPGQVYPLRALAVAAVMIPFLGLYRALGWRIDPVAVGVGVAIAVMWIFIPVAPAEAPPYGAMTGALLILWFIARGIGTSLLVPVFEELFFRDYLEGLFRRGSGKGWAVGAALTSATLFAVLHDRWAEAFVAGLLFSWLAARPGGRITDAIIAHMVANGMIFAVALVMGRFEII